MSTIRKRLIAYLVVIPLFCFVAVFQWRASRDTVHVERMLDFYVPFSLQSFSNRIDSRAYTPSFEEGGRFDPHNYSVLHWGDELVRVNGLEFNGMSVYLGELWKVLHRPSFRDASYRPFTVTVRSDGSRIHRVVVSFPHCTCGVPTMFEAAAIWIVPPAFCVLLGFTMVTLRPSAMGSWAFLLAMLSLSQLQLWPEWHTGFQQTITPMQWADWLRVPGVGYQGFVRCAWPAAFVIFWAHVFRARCGVRRAAFLVAISFLGFAALKAMLQIAWSENFRGFVSLYRQLESQRSELIVAGLAAAAGLCWSLNRNYGLIVTAMGLSAVAALYWSPLPITHGNWYNYSDDTFRFVATIPDFHNTPGLIILAVTAGCILAGIVTFRSRLTLWELGGSILLVPLAIHIGGCFGGYWFPVEWGMFAWGGFVLASAGVGLICLGWSIFKATRASSRVPALQARVPAPRLLN